MTVGRETPLHGVLARQTLKATFKAARGGARVERRGGYGGVGGGGYGEGSDDDSEEEEEGGASLCMLM